MLKRPDEEKETLGFLKWNFSQQIPTSLPYFSRLSVDYKAEERKFCVLAKLLFYEFLEEEGK